MRRPARLKAGRTMSLAALAVPAFAWFTVFLAAPLAIVLVYSFAARGTYGGIEFHFSFANYLRMLDPIYLSILKKSLLLALVTSLACLLIGYPMAYVIARAPRRLRSVLLILVVIPFWTNFVIRTYALRVILSENGLVNSWLLKWGVLSSPFVFVGSDFAIGFGMVTNYLPFMVLPLYVALEKFDFTLLEAARDLGAPRWRQLASVLLPLTREGIFTGCVFVFAPALGEFVIPDILGGARKMLIGNLITEQFLKIRDWPFGSALSLALMLGVMLSLLVYLRAERRA